MPHTVDAPARRWKVDAPGEQPATVAIRVYERKDSGDYHFTPVSGDQNATLVQDLVSGDVYFTDSIVAGSIIYQDETGQMSIFALPVI